MTAFLLDTNISDALGHSRVSSPLAHDVATARALGLATATDSQILYAAAQSRRILLTHDKGFDCLHEAWQDWIVGHGLGPAHSGIVQLAPFTTADPVIAQKLDFALRAGWKPRGDLWLLDLRLGWRRMRARRRWSVWDPASPLGLMQPASLAFDVNPEAKGLRLWLVRAKEYLCP